MEMYDIAECAARAKAAIERMHTTVRPGAQTGRGGKAAVLRAVREQLRSALRAEYTVPQLVDALREVFGGELAAKTVRAALRDAGDGAARTTKRRRQRKTTGVAAAPEPAAAAPTAAPVSSHVDPVDGPVQAASEGPPAPAPVSEHPVPAAPEMTPAGGRLTPEQRAQYQVPEWGDGSDLRPGETLEKYARRKRLEGDPAQRQDRSKCIGES